MSLILQDAISSIQQRAPKQIIICAIAATILKTYEAWTGDFPSTVPVEELNGAVSMACKGERYQTEDGQIIDKSREKLSPVTLQLDFQNGIITRWSAEPTPAQKSEDLNPDSHLLSNFQAVCSKHPADCQPTVKNNGNHELYAFNNATGLLSQDLRNFTSHSINNGKTTTNALSCEIS
jgi:hypothetical protein